MCSKHSKQVPNECHDKKKKWFIKSRTSKSIKSRDFTETFPLIYILLLHLHFERDVSVYFWPLGAYLLYNAIITWKKREQKFTLFPSKQESAYSLWMPRLIWIFAGRTGHFIGFVTQRLKFQHFTHCSYINSDFTSAFIRYKNGWTENSLKTQYVH